jgi:hypothetical protein
MSDDTATQTRDAIIFIPGLGEWVDQSADGIARRIAISMDRNAKTVSTQFTVLTQGREEDYGRSESSSYKTRVAAIQRMDDGQPGSEVDVYALSYNSNLNKNYADKNLVLKSLRLFLGILINLPRFGGAFITKNRAKSFSEILQFIFAILILSLLVVYMVMLAAAVVEIVINSPQFTQALQNTSRETPTPQVQPTQAGSASEGASGPATGESQSAVSPNQPAADQTQPLTISQLVIILLAIVEVFIPDLKAQISRAAVDYMSVIDYLSLGERRQVIAGQLADLVEHIAEKGSYRYIHMIAFSFGSVVAMDNLFPFGENPGERFRLVHSLVTIGCPFDLIRQFWPSYFGKREAWPGTPDRWLNVYSPVDILSSNFRNDRKQERAEITVSIKDNGAEPPIPENLVYTHGIDPSQLSPLSWVTLLGLRAHTMYWEAQEDSDVNCFKAVTKWLYGADPLLD